MKPADADARSRWLASLLEQHGGALALYAAQWTSAADDCVQEALVELAGQKSIPENVVAWLYHVVKRRALNRARSERRRTAREQVAWTARLQLAGNQHHRHELLETIAELPPDQCELILLKTWGGLTFEEIAQVVGESSSTVHRRYHEALDQLRKLMEVPCPETTKTP